MWRQNYKYQDLFAGHWPIKMEIVHVVNNNMCYSAQCLSYDISMADYIKYLLSGVSYLDSLFLQHFFYFP